ncbi:hypothetical protein T11_5681 [Trichinella zimbabwensis]|uniref:Uncharacterized protein n=1 Tax=Trichinella zimbabwensis TaxID=268475 RepID=A0A0V1HIP5_9BILA|nr:hypothetical protein T11_5681 [Trichinella zimbabwensis]
MSIKEKKTFVLDLQNYLQILIDLTRQLKLMLCEQKMFLNRSIFHLIINNTLNNNNNNYRGNGGCVFGNGNGVDLNALTVT